MMASNMSDKSDEAGCNVDNDGLIIILSGIVPTSKKLLWRKMELLKTGGNVIGV